MKFKKLKLLFIALASFFIFQSPADAYFTRGQVYYNDDYFIESVVNTINVGTINLKSNVNVLIFTVPAGRQFVLTGVNAKVVSTSAITVGPTISVGISPSYDEWSSATIMTGFTTATVNQSFDITKNIPSYVFQAGDNITLKNTTATGTTLTAQVTITGYLI